jgi:hypothetical protein
VGRSQGSDTAKAYTGGRTRAGESSLQLQRSACVHLQGAPRPQLFAPCEIAQGASGLRPNPAQSPEPSGHSELRSRLSGLCVRPCASFSSQGPKARPARQKPLSLVAAAPAFLRPSVSERASLAMSTRLWAERSPSAKSLGPLRLGAGAHTAPMAGHTSELRSL